MATTKRRTRPIPFYQHGLGRAELDAIAGVFAGPILTTGETVAQFERRFAEYLGRRHALGVMSCTGALHIALLALGIGPGDEVITTPMTFVATSLAIMETGATPVFVDVEAETGNIDAARVEAAITERTRAILPVHLYGQMVDMRALRAIADRHDLRIVEDAAHCIEGSRDGVRPGDLSDAACYSFYATKSITCGEGGAVVTDDTELAKSLRLLRLHGVTKTAHDREREGFQHWDTVTLGWKYNMDNIQAAILLPQLDRIDRDWQRRKELGALYEERLRTLPDVRFPATRPSVAHARHLFTIWIGGDRRDAVVKGLRALGIGAMVNYDAIHPHTLFRERLKTKIGDFPQAERIGRETISLPFHARLEPEEVDGVVDALRSVLDEAH
ncbi:MAG: DegT/DnrJ/EryC1/StrS family aminotransferase [Chloroflexota bacterium]